VPKQVNTQETTDTNAVPKHLRRLKSNELVSVGDFVANDRQEFERWEGPGGFRADSFIKPIYRRDESPAPAAKDHKKII
jgi:hypothetical protein